jgi:hypothetical protein
LSDGTTTAHLAFSGTYVFDNFKFASDGSGGTLVIDPPVQSVTDGSANPPAGNSGSGSAPAWWSNSAPFNFSDNGAGHGPLDLLNLKASDIFAHPGMTDQAHGLLNLLAGSQDAPPHVELESLFNDHLNLALQHAQLTSHGLLSA